MLRGLFTYSADERRATIAGINLFFSALLGANLGVLSDIPLADYVKLILLLAGAVMAVLTIAVAKRRITVISTSVSLATILACVAIVPGFGVEGMEGNVNRMAVTLAVWLVMLLMVRFTPSAGEAPAGAGTEDDEIVVPASGSIMPDGGGRN